MFIKINFIIPFVYVPRGVFKSVINLNKQQTQTALRLDYKHEWIPKHTTQQIKIGIER